MASRPGAAYAASEVTPKWVLICWHHLLPPFLIIPEEGRLHNPISRLMSTISGSPDPDNAPNIQSRLYLTVKAEEMRVGPILSAHRQYVVPYFQRTYSWRRQQWITLFDDIVELDELGREHT